MIRSSGELWAAFGRSATLGYDGAGRLAGITDVAGMTSTFTYGAGDFIVAMTTPYGTTAFRKSADQTSSTFRFIEATDPAGGRERLEFHLHDATLPATAPASEVPAGFSVSNADLDYWNSFYWDKPAMAAGAGDRSKAVNYTWMMAPDAAYGHPMSRPVPHTVKRPLESRVWYRYAGQTSTSSHGISGLRECRPLLSRPRRMLERPRRMLQRAQRTLEKRNGEFIRLTTTAVRSMKTKFPRALPDHRATDRIRLFDMMKLTTAFTRVENTTSSRIPFVILTLRIRHFQMERHGLAILDRLTSITGASTIQV